MVLARTKQIRLALTVIVAVWVFGCIAGCSRKTDNEMEVIEGRLEMLLAGAGYTTLITEDNTRYQLRLMPDYKYIDRTSKNPPNAKGQIESFILGYSGKYRCKGKKKTLAEESKEATSQGKSRYVLAVEGTNYLFDVCEIELLETRER